MAERNVRPTWAEVDLDAITSNVQALAGLVAPSKVCAVVKAFAYGHGPVRVTEAALRGGAVALGVALVEEGRQIREAGFDVPIFVLSEPSPEAMAEVVKHKLIPSVYTHRGIEALAAVVSSSTTSMPCPVQVKVDTGMHRVGIDWNEANDFIAHVLKTPELVLGGVFTHFAVADEPQNPFTIAQIERFNSVLAQLRADGVEPDLVHAANSAGAMFFPTARYDMVRCGVAIYGIPPTNNANIPIDLVPALSLKSKVTYLKRVNANERISYGLRYELARASNIATAPIGYADGYSRRLGVLGTDVLISGKRYPIAGTVTMDQIMIDCGDDEVSLGDEIVLLGRQGNEEITAWDLATKLDDIGYTTVCAISARVPRRYVARLQQ